LLHSQARGEPVFVFIMSVETRGLELPWHQGRLYYPKSEQQSPPSRLRTPQVRSDASLIKDIQLWDAGITKVAALAAKRQKLVSQFARNSDGRQAYLRASTDAQLLSDHHEYHAHRMRVRERKIQALSATLDGARSLSVTERQAIKRKLNALSGWQTRERKLAEVDEPSASHSAKVDLATRRKSRTKTYTVAKEAALAKKSHEVDAAIAKHIEEITALPLVKHPSVYGRLDGALRIDYATQNGESMHKLLFLLAQRNLPHPESAKVIARYIVDKFVEEGDYERLANPEFAALLKGFAGQFNDADTATAIRRAAIEGIVLRLKHGETGKESPVIFDADVATMNADDIDGLFGFFANISSLQRAAERKHRMEKRKDAILRIPDPKRRTAMEAQYAKVVTSIATRQPSVTKAYGQLMRSPFLDTQLMQKATAEAPDQRKRTILYHIPGLTLPHIEALLDHATVIGGRRDTSSTFALWHLTKNAHPHAKQQPGFAETSARIKNTMIMNGQGYDQSDPAKAQLQMDARRDAHRIPLTDEERGKLENEVARRVRTLPQIIAEAEQQEKDKRAWHFSTAPVVSEGETAPTRNDVWLSDVLKRTAELGLYKDKKVLALLGQLADHRPRSIYEQVDQTVIVSKLFRYVYDKLPWWQQGKAGYHAVDDTLFTSMASHWVQHHAMKGVESLLTLDEQSPQAIAELLNPEKWKLTQRSWNE
jgi:hypothetical protein